MKKTMSMLLALLFTVSVGGYIAAADAHDAAPAAETASQDIDQSTTCSASADDSITEDLASSDVPQSQLFGCASWRPNGCCGTTNRWRRRCWVGADTWFENKCEGPCFQ